MIPYPYNMVDMGGIDLAEANGTVVEGLYAKIVEAVNACGDVVLYNWKFAGIEISPQHTSILLGDPIIISGAVQVTEQDEVTVPGINPDPKVLVPIEITENGQYDPSDYDADGFSEVGVNVEYDPPVLVSLSVSANGTYLPSQYDAVGFSSVLVDVQGGASTLHYNVGKLAINTGQITEDADFCYSDLIPITSPIGRWYLDLARQTQDLSSYNIGLCFYAEDGVTQLGYIRQYEAYRSYQNTSGSGAKYCRIANKSANMSYACVVSLIDNIHIVSQNSTVLKGE